MTLGRSRSTVASQNSTCEEEKTRNDVSLSLSVSLSLPRYRRVSEGWKGRVFGVEDISILNHRCISAMGHISLILPHLRQLMGK